MIVNSLHHLVRRGRKLFQKRSIRPNNPRTEKFINVMEGNRGGQGGQRRQARAIKGGPWLFFLSSIGIYRSSTKVHIRSAFCSAIHHFSPHPPTPRALPLEKIEGVSFCQFTPDSGKSPAFGRRRLPVRGAKEVAWMAGSSLPKLKFIGTASECGGF